jgi:acyl-coenzyme A synthetase/AMP-(fatty) acid ligase
VVAIPSDGFEGTMICCAYVSGSDSAVNEATLRNGLRRIVPSYMMPSRWMAFDRLPKNSSGKIDRPRLRELFLHEETETHVRAAHTAQLS